MEPGASMPPVFTKTHPLSIKWIQFILQIQVCVRSILTDYPICVKALLVTFCPFIYNANFKSIPTVLHSSYMTCPSLSRRYNNPDYVGNHAVPRYEASSILVPLGSEY